MSHTTECKVRHQVSPYSTTGPVWEVVGSWAVTKYGLEHLDGPPYEIDIEYLGTDQWIAQLADKNWCNILDFKHAYLLALKAHKVANAVPQTPWPHQRLETLPGGRLFNIFEI